MTSAREWLARLMDSNIPVFNTFGELESRDELRTFADQVDGTCEEFSVVLGNLMGFVNYLRECVKAPEKRWRACLDCFILLAGRAREKCRDKFSSSLCQDVVIFLESVNEYRQASTLAYEYLRDQPRIDSSYHLTYTFSWSFPHQLESCVKRGDHAGAVKLADLLFSFVQRGQGNDRSRQALVAYAWFTVLDMPGQAAACLELLLDRPDKTKSIEWAKSWSSRWNQAISLYRLAGNLEKAVQLCEASGRLAKAKRLKGEQAFAIEEIAFPRGQNRKLAVAIILGDYAMKAEAYLDAGQIEEAKEISQIFVTGYRRGGRATRLEEVLLRHEMSDEAKRILQAKADWTWEKVREWLAMNYDVVNYGREDDSVPPYVVLGLEDTAHYDILLNILRSPKYSFYGDERAVAEARTLYHLGRKLEAAKVAERRWCPDTEPPKIDSSGYYEAGSETYYDCWFYDHQLGVASLYEDAGDHAGATAFLQKTERKWRKQGRWQAVLGLYFDLGRLSDVERVAREEDELECAIIAYQAANQPEEAARICDEIGAKTKPRSEHKSERKTAAEVQSPGQTQHQCSCGQNLDPDWIACPRCGKKVARVCSCGQRLEENWTFCPKCGAATGS